MSKIIGIDLGTTNTVTSVFDGEEPVIICPSPNQRAVPSIVALDDTGQWLVGEAARNQQVTNPNDTVYSIKRFMGRRHSEVASEEKLVPYEVSGKTDEFVRVAIGKHKLTPQEISARILQSVKAMAEGQLGQTVKGAVITVPAYFNDAQRQATRDAGRIAGIAVERIINEPTAAAVAYGLEKKGEKCIVVFDLGGGTFDLSAMKINKGSFQVLAVHGNTHLGGDDFDQRILDVVAEDFLRKERIDIRQDPMALQRLKQAAQVAKATLSEQYETKIMLPFICVDESGPKHLDYKLTRKRFEAICADLFDNVRACCRTLMDEANLTPKDVDEVVLVGGSTRIPKVQSVAKEVFSTKQLNKSINPDEVVAIGAAIIGGIMQGDLQNVELMDVTSHGFGVEIAGGKTEFLLKKNTPIPTEVKKVFSTPANNQTSVPINVLEGEAEAAKENRALGTFRLTGIRKAPRGVPQIEVAFKIDANGILEVTAMDKDTGKSQVITVTGGCGLGDDEIEKMKAPAQKAESDAARRAERVELKNKAETFYANTLKWVEYNAGAISPKGRNQISGGLEKLRKTIDKNDEKGMRASMKKLEELRTSYRKAS